MVAYIDIFFIAYNTSNWISVKENDLVWHGAYVLITFCYTSYWNCEVWYDNQVYIFFFGNHLIDHPCVRHPYGHFLAKLDPLLRTTGGATGRTMFLRRNRLPIDNNQKYQFHRIITISLHVFLFDVYIIMYQSF